MAAQDGEIKARFLVIPGTDVRRFQAAVRSVYRGEASDEDVSYLLDHTRDVICGHDPEVMRRSGSMKGKSNV